MYYVSFVVFHCYPSFTLPGFVPAGNLPCPGLFIEINGILPNDRKPVYNSMLLITALVILFTLIIYKFIVQPAHYWDKFGVSHPGWLTYLYFNYFAFLKKQSAAYFVQEMYDGVKDVRLFGFHQANVPTLLLKDPEVIKQVAIKAFDHFTDRKFNISVPEEPLLGQNLLNLKGQKWREMRSYLSPTFTTNKMKMLFRIMDTCGEKFVQHFLSKDGDIVETDMQNAFTRYTNDVIASSVFGIEVDSLSDPNNEFYLRGREATDFTKPVVATKMMFSVLAPTLYRFLGLRLLSKRTTDFFVNLIDDSIKLREEGKIVQQDMMYMLLEAKREYEAQQKKEDNTNVNGCITTDDIMAQAFIFFFAGFESVARTMCFMAYELAVNPEIQEKLRSEIEDVSEKCHGKITYDELMGMKYMEMVVSEVLRKYPIQVGTDRICTKPYVLESDQEGEKPVSIDVGTSILIPTYAIHHDSKYFPNPEIFDPERFSDENKSAIPSYAYQPFSLGPRMCIGSRFALMETKLVYFHLLRKFEILPTQSTKIPLVLLRNVMSLTSEHGFHFGLKKL